MARKTVTPRKRTHSKGLSKTTNMKLWMKFKGSPALLNMQQVGEAEDTFHAASDGVTRRVGLTMLSKSGAELIEGVRKDPAFGKACYETAELIRAYGKRLHILADMMETAGTRMVFASAAALPGAPS